MAPRKDPYWRTAASGLCRYCHGDPRGRTAASLWPALQHAITVEVGGFAESLEQFLAQGEVDLVLDATHPFAVRITQIAAAVCSRMHLPYIRYQRPDWEPPAGTVYAASYAEAADMLPALAAASR